MKGSAWAHPQLARRYFEVGKSLFESKDKYMRLDGLKAEEYLNKAKALFEEMKLETALEELGQVVETGGSNGR